MGALRTTAAASLILLLTLCLGASTFPENPGQTEGVLVRTADPSFLHGTDGGSVDRLAAMVVTELRTYWHHAYPENFGSPWREPDGGYFSADPTRTSDPAPPCSASVADIEGNAYYCPAVDAVAWDRAALLPVLREHYGEGAVTVVLAHELGHVVQRRAGQYATSPRAEPVADCYAGSFLRWVSDGHSRNLRLSPTALDAALRALTVFQDPVGSGSTAPANAHGTARERVSAFQQGFRSGPKQCFATINASSRGAGSPGAGLPGASSPGPKLPGAKSGVHEKLPRTEPGEHQ